jgi:hypothetical protein
MNKAVFYGFHRCSKIHPAKYFDRPAKSGPADTAAQATPIEPAEVSNPFLDPAHAEIRKRLEARNEAERESPTVTESEPPRESPAADEALSAEEDPVQSVAAFNEPAPPVPSGPSGPSESSGGFACRGKVHCSEMVSCEEAEFYLRNCPGTKMDGDGDGKPCEDRCGH